MSKYKETRKLRTEEITMTSYKHAHTKKKNQPKTKIKKKAHKF